MTLRIIPPARGTHPPHAASTDPKTDCSTGTTAPRDAASDAASGHPLSAPRAFSLGPSSMVAKRPHEVAAPMKWLSACRECTRSRSDRAPQQRAERLLPALLAAGYRNIRSLSQPFGVYGKRRGSWAYQPNLRALFPLKTAEQLHVMSIGGL